MKNIHVLPTAKPSRLWFHKLNRNLGFSDLPMEYNGSGTWVEGRNIYITSDEEIKEGDWVLGDFPDNPIGKVISKYGQEFTAQSLNGDKYGLAEYDSKKIILTTDQDLIKDGVQEIDDEFLKWFVKNPSCEVIFVNKIESFDFEIDKYVYNYKIIIPKEEPKTGSITECIKMIVDNQLNELEEPKQDAINYSLNAFKVPKEYFGKEEPKQETLKEVAKRLSNTTDEFNQFVAGAKWQQEQDKTKYSEEEVFELLKKFAPHIRYNHKELPHTWQQVVKEWFEQFKNK
jgi:hypothetical protein